jgi:glycosyltransferase involved in cell wall biosynthesis
LDNPFDAIAAFDIFALLSTAHEGISQASLQAAYLEKPLITTPVGGLPEVCLDGKTGLIVPPFAPKEIAEAVIKLMDAAETRREMGIEARKLVENRFLFEHTLNGMETVYRVLYRT